MFILKGVFFLLFVTVCYIISNIIVVKSTARNIRESYVTMTKEELLELEQDELIDAMVERIQNRYSNSYSKNVEDISNVSEMKLEEQVILINALSMYQGYNEQFYSKVEKKTYQESRVIGNPSVVLTDQLLETNNNILSKEDAYNIIGIETSSSVEPIQIENQLYEYIITNLDQLVGKQTRRKQ